MSTLSLTVAFSFFNSSRVFNTREDGVVSIGEAIFSEVTATDYFLGDSLTDLPLSLKTT